MDYVELLKKNKLTLLKDKVNEIQVAAGEFVIHQGRYPKYLYILLEGKVKVFHTNRNGQKFLFGIFDTPQLYGDLEIPNNDKFFNSVQCISTCRFVQMRIETYTYWMNSDPEFATKVNKDLCTKLMKSSYRMVDNNFFSLEYHLLKYLVELTHDFAVKSIQIDKNDIANYIGTNTRSINRLLKQFSSDQLICIKKDQLEVLNWEEINRRIKKFF